MRCVIGLIRGRMLSKLYARAYLNVFSSQLSFESMEPIDQLASFLNAHKQILFLLRVPLIDPRIKCEGLYDLVDRFKAPSSLKKLIKTIGRP